MNKGLLASIIFIGGCFTTGFGIEQGTISFITGGIGIAIVGLVTALSATA